MKDHLAKVNGLRPWQEESFIKVIKPANRAEQHQVIPVNGCVGSGKTKLASLAFADYVDLHKDEKTIQVFVTPRIKLCKQQLSELAESIAKLDPYSYQQFKKFGEGGDYQLVPVDCQNRDWNRKNDSLYSKHSIFIICEESLWGKDEDDPDKRWRQWIGRLKRWTKQGYKLGCIAFDETHNYKGKLKVKKMLGQQVLLKGAPVEYADKDCLLNLFQSVMLLSGTPADYQKSLSKMYKSCECPLNLAIKKGWICSPRLNLVSLGGFLTADVIFSNAIVKVLQHEQSKVKPVNGVRLLVNFSSIDEIRKFSSDPYVQASQGKDFHFLTIHSPKDFSQDDDSCLGEKLVSQIDGEAADSGLVYDLLEALDDGVSDDKDVSEKLKQVLDGKPIIVGQVEMIGEGINIKSFSSVITKSNSHTKAMQQIGRVLRLFKGKTEPNVYCVYDNVESLKELLTNLMSEHSLTADVFKWGDKIDVSTGSSPSAGQQREGDAPSDPTPIEWLPIDPSMDADIFYISTTPEFQEKKAVQLTKSFVETDKFERIVKRFSAKMPEELLKRVIHSMRIRSSKLTAAGMNSAKTAQSAKKKYEKKPCVGKSESVTSLAQSFIIHVIENCRLFVLKNKECKGALKLFRETPDAFTNMVFSYETMTADLIKETKLLSDKEVEQIVWQL